MCKYAPIRRHVAFEIDPKRSGGIHHVALSLRLIVFDVTSSRGQLIVPKVGTCPGSLSHQSKSNRDRQKQNLKEVLGLNNL